MQWNMFLFKPILNFKPSRLVHGQGFCCVKGKVSERSGRKRRLKDGLRINVAIQWSTSKQNMHTYINHTLVLGMQLILTERPVKSPHRLSKHYIHWLIIIEWKTFGIAARHEEFYPTSWFNGDCLKKIKTTTTKTTSVTSVLLLYSSILTFISSSVLSW